MAQNRADKTRLLVETFLRTDLPGIRIAPGVSRIDDQKSEAEVGSYGIGSRDALLRRHGDRTSNEAADRAVTVKIELLTTEYGEAGVSLPQGSMPGKSRFWYVKLIRYHVDAAGAALGYVEMQLRNSFTGKVMRGQADLYGGGLSSGVLTKDPRETIKAIVLNRLKAAAADAKGHKEILFETAKEIGFEDFDEKFVTFERAQAQIFVGGQVLFLSFTGLGHDARLIPISHGVSFGIKPSGEGYAVSGVLHMIGDYPSDTREYDRQGYVQTRLDRSSGDSLTISFPTQQSDVAAPELLRLRQFVKTWTQKLGA